MESHYSYDKNGRVLLNGVLVKIHSKPLTGDFPRGDNRGYVRYVDNIHRVVTLSLRGDGRTFYCTPEEISVIAATYRQDEMKGVYAVATREMPYVKIGKAIDPLSRIKDLQIGCPIDLILIGILHYGDEKKEHDFYSTYRHRGEWFKFHEKLYDSLLSRYRLYSIAREPHILEITDDSLVKISTLQRAKQDGYYQSSRPRVRALR